MRVIAKKEESRIIDLYFIWEPTKIDEEGLLSNLRYINNFDIMIKDSLTIRYTNFRRFIEIKEEVWLNFHTQAGNSLSLNVGTYLIIQPAITS